MQEELNKQALFKGAKELDSKAMNMLEATEKAIGKIQGELKAKPGNIGTIECPNCKGKLDWAIAKNGHCWGRCQTEGCLSWAE